ncbi:hypothetical protein IIB51_00675 [Patescibacteria group bacterium]|nr:hypothetical protein [Patescibacteria group bacterium]
MKNKASSKTNTGTRSLIVFDIGSGSVGAALAILSPKKLPKILYSTRNAISFHETAPRLDKLTKAMLATLLNTMFEVQSVTPQLLKNEGIFLKGKLVDHVLTTFSSPWATVEIRRLSINKEEPFTMTRQISERFVKEAISKFIGEDTKTTPIKSRNRNLASVDCEIIRTTLNGYQTSNPYDKPVKRLQIDLGLSAISREIHNQTSEIVGELLPDDSVDFHAFPLASFLAARDVFEQSDDFVLLDISAEMSDISLVDGGTLVHLASFTGGRHLVFREISKFLKVPIEETRSLLHLYLCGKMSQKQESDFIAIMESVRAQWTSSFSLALNKIRQTRPLPNTLLLLADKDLSGWFKKIIEPQSEQETMPDMQHFEVTVLDGTYLANYITWLGGEWALDPFLALDILFYKRKLGI